MVTTTIFGPFFGRDSYKLLFATIVGKGENPRNSIASLPKFIQETSDNISLEFRFGEMLRVAMISVVASGHLQGVLPVGSLLKFQEETGR